MNLKIVIEHHPECLVNRSRLAAVLRDLYPNEILLANIVLEVYECGIVDRLRSMTNVDSTQAQAFCHQLATEYALPMQVALQGLEMWADAYGVSIESKFITAAPADSINVSDQKNSTIISNDPFAHTEIVEGNPLEYEVKEVEPGIVEITRFLGFDEKDMIIPNMISGNRVVGIGGYGVFRNCQKIESVTIADGIEYIGREAFYHCEKLKRVKMNMHLKSICNFAFSYTQIDRICFPLSLVSFEEYALHVYGGHGEKGVIMAYVYPGTKAIASARRWNMPLKNAEDWPGYN